MRKQDYKRLIELCSVERATAPYTLTNVVPPQHFASLELSYNPNSKLDADLREKINVEFFNTQIKPWDEKVNMAIAEGKVKADDKAKIRELFGDRPFSKPFMCYKGHQVQYRDNTKATVAIDLGETSYSEHTLAHQIDSSRVAWSFGPSSFIILEDDEQKRYILFGDRSKAIAHTTQAIEREFFPKGYFYTDNLSKLTKGREFDGKTILETLIRSQLSDQTNFTEAIVNKADIEIVGAFLIPAPHFDANASGVIKIKLPCKAKDFGQFHKGKKYISSTLVKFEDLTSLVESEGDNLTPISRTEIYQWAVRHPEIVE